MKNFRLVCLLFYIINLNVYGQYNGLGFMYPLDREIAVTGNYGELRPNHFHAGIDFSTDPVINLPIKSASDGYVSRIKLSSGGYGRVIYITHPNGFVTVYAHQKRFAQKIDAYVKQQQFLQKKNEIELFPKPREIKIGKGEVIGYTGNTGSSTGPHLHFEIRDEKTEVPFNPLLFYDVKDDIKPTLTHLVIYNTADTNHITSQQIITCNANTNKAGLTKNTIITNQNTFAIGFSGYDMANATPNKNNIYEAKVALDGQTIYHHQLNFISFDNARYVNYFSEKLNAIKFQKCFTPTCYDIGIYKTLINYGKIELKDTLQHTIELTLTDEKGNATRKEFYIKTKKITGYKIGTDIYNAFCNRECSIKKEDIEWTIKPNALTRSCFVAAYINKTGKLNIGDKNNVLLKPFEFSVKINKPIASKEKKLVLLNDNNCLTGLYENGWFKTESKNFGLFSIEYDTVGPKINFNQPVKNVLIIKSSISFKLSDAMSGIGEYAVYINGAWQIAEYDAKSSTVTCYIDNTIISRKLKIKIEATDKVGNIAIMEFEGLKK